MSVARSAVAISRRADAESSLHQTVEEPDCHTADQKNRQAHGDRGGSHILRIGV